MQIREAMTPIRVTVGPSHTLREAAVRMTLRDVGAAVVIDPEGEGPAVLTERDVLRAAAQGHDLDAESVGGHLAGRALTCAPDWSLERAAQEMVRHRVRHMLVCDAGDVVGMLSVRDIVRCWATDGATCDLEPVGSAPGQRAGRPEAHPDQTPVHCDPAVDAGAAMRRLGGALDEISGF